MMLLLLLLLLLKMMLGLNSIQRCKEMLKQLKRLLAQHATIL
jgi:hypothetical protein